MNEPLPSQSTPEIDFDGAWKEALDRYLAAALALLFPTVHAAVDWSRPPLARDGELQQVVRDAAVPRTHVDKLVQVWLHDGGEVWLLLHIEVQSQVQAEFPARMFQYHSRLKDRFGCEVVSLAILGDESARWRPTEYRNAVLGCVETLRYPTAKLHDFRAQRAELAMSDNPFTLVVEAHLAAQDTRGDGAGRRAVKVGLLRRLYARGYGREDILEIFRLIDWLLALPTEQEEQFVQDVVEIETEGQMAYVTSVERVGHQRGLVAGREEGLIVGREEGLTVGRETLRRVLQGRFGAIPPLLDERIAALDALDALNALLLKAAMAASLEEVERG